MGVGEHLPLAKSKGVSREAESGGSWRQTPGLRYTNLIRVYDLGRMKAIGVEKWAEAVVIRQWAF
jgi:hypothetical protein